MDPKSSRSLNTLFLRLVSLTLALSLTCSFTWYFELILHVELMGIHINPRNTGVLRGIPNYPWGKTEIFRGIFQSHNRKEKNNCIS